MARLYLFAEGQTEQTFAHNVLGPHLARHGVYMNKPVLIANAHKKQRTHRGGGGSFAAMQKDICRFLSQDRGRDAFFTLTLQTIFIRLSVNPLFHRISCRFSTAAQIHHR